MEIQTINNNRVSFSKGLYFTKTPYILFNKKTPINYFANEKFKYNLYNSKISTSKEGFRYIEDDIISLSMKKKISDASFIKDLSEKFDTFVVAHKPSFIDEVKKYTSVLEIFWADYSKDEAQNEVVIGHSKNSESCAVDNMLHKLSVKDFSPFKF